MHCLITQEAVFVLNTDFLIIFMQQEGIQHKRKDSGRIIVQLSGN